MFLHFGGPAEEAACPSSAGSENVAGFSWRPDAAASGKKTERQTRKKKQKKTKTLSKHVPAWMYTNNPSLYCFDFFFFYIHFWDFPCTGMWKTRKRKSFPQTTVFIWLTDTWATKLLTRQRPYAQTFLVKCYFLKLQSSTCPGDFTTPKMTKEHIQNISVGEVRVWVWVCVCARMYVQYIYIYIYILYV